MASLTLERTRTGRRYNNSRAIIGIRISGSVTPWPEELCRVTAAGLVLVEFRRQVHSPAATRKEMEVYCGIAPLLHKLVVFYWT